MQLVLTLAAVSTVHAFVSHKTCFLRSTEPQQTTYYWALKKAAYLQHDLFTGWIFNSVENFDHE